MGGNGEQRARDLIQKMTNMRREDEGRDLALVNGKLPLHESHAEWGNKRQKANASMGLASFGTDTFLHAAAAVVQDACCA